MSKAEVAQAEPYAVDVVEGKAYFWCACGKSKKQPFCDGSHNGTDFQPVPWKADSSGTKYFCGCKQSAGQPFCDGSHNSL